MSLKPNLAAKFKFLPQGSQVLVVLFGLSSALAAFVSMWFILLPQPHVWLLPLAISAGFAWLAYLCWRASHVNADAANASPASITKSDGSVVSVDSRALGSPTAMAQFIKVLQMVNDRAFLPQADGMVNANGTPDPNRAAEASHIVAAANTESMQIASKVITG